MEQQDARTHEEVLDDPDHALVTVRVLVNLAKRNERVTGGRVVTVAVVTVLAVVRTLETAVLGREEGHREALVGIDLLGDRALIDGPGQLVQRQRPVAVVIVVLESPLEDLAISGR